MRIINKISLILLTIFTLTTCVSFAEDKEKGYLFQGEVNSDNINIRSDSTTTAQVISKINKSEYVDVLSESYGWYKIRLPANTPSFINKKFVSLVDDKTAKVLKDNVNIRLRPDTASPILGNANKDDTVNILGDSGEWYKIEATANSYGWVHKTFVNKSEKKQVKLAKKTETEAEKTTAIDKNITVEGIIRPKTFTRIASHKLITDDDKVYLLKGNRESLNPLNRHRVKITGQLADPTKQEDPIIEVEKIEALD